MVVVVAAAVVAPVVREDTMHVDLPKKSLTDDPDITAAQLPQGLLPDSATYSIFSAGGEWNPKPSN